MSINGLQRSGSATALVGSLNAARIYSYLTGGKDNLTRERELGDQLLAEIPGLGDAVRANRRFTAVAIETAAAMGITQFIDLGCGLPASPNVHETARALTPAARVAYVDYDPLVMSHETNVLAEGGKSSWVRAVTADIGEPETLLKTVDADKFIDFQQPVALIIAAVLQFTRWPRDIMRVYREALPPGSLLALSHPTNDGWEDEETKLIAQVCEETRTQVFLRGREEIEELFGGLNLTAPGLADVTCYAGPSRSTRNPARAYAGIAVRKEE